MHFLSRVSGLVQEVSRPRQGHRSLVRRGSPIALEMLETRNLMSVPGVSLSYGNLSIIAPSGSSGNVAKVWIDSSTHNVDVSFNGKSESFTASSVSNITYEGGRGGGDTFTNDTSLVSLDYGFGSHNNFTGGTSYNYVYFYGTGNTYNAQKGSFTDVFEIGGSDTINNPTGAGMQIYVYA
jgi:hypothetical protein